jgi:hypothetical protein
MELMNRILAAALLAEGEEVLCITGRYIRLRVLSTYVLTNDPASAEFDARDRENYFDENDCDKPGFLPIPAAEMA